MALESLVFLTPTRSDETQLFSLHAQSSSRFRVLKYGADWGRAPERLDSPGFVDAAVHYCRAQDARGVMATGDYPGILLASSVASREKLPGPSLRSVLRCAHKYSARCNLAESVPEANPQFACVSPDGFLYGGLPPFPVYVKPVKSTFSKYAQRVNNEGELQRYLQSPGLRAHLTDFVRPFNQLLDQFPKGEFPLNGGHVLVEELLTGRQVTLEGFVFQGNMTVVGIVDTAMYPGFPSFARFDYPSSIGNGVASRLVAIAERAVAHVGLDNGLFNFEFMCDLHTDAVHIIEINPRMCSQFADLMQAVNGTNTYEILLALAAGDRPPPVMRGGGHGVATSYVLRRFRDARVMSVPSADCMDELRTNPHVLRVEHYYGEGERLSDNNYEFDGISYRYGLVNLAGEDRHEVDGTFQRIRARLEMTFE